MKLSWGGGNWGPAGSGEIRGPWEDQRCRQCLRGIGGIRRAGSIHGRDCRGGKAVSAEVVKGLEELAMSTRAIEGMGGRQHPEEGLGGRWEPKKRLGGGQVASAGGLWSPGGFGGIWGALRVCRETCRGDQAILSP